MDEIFDERERRPSAWPRAAWPCSGPLRLARLRPPGLRRLPEGDAAGDAPVRHQRCPTGSLPARRSARRRRTGYLAAMACAANYAWANRQAIMHWVREALRGTSSAQARRDSACELVYDVCHNIAKFEEHEVDGAHAHASACTARAPRAPSRPGTRRLPAVYRDVGQPVLVPGDMGTASYVLVGTAARDGADLGHHLPRRGPADEPHRRHPAGQAARNIAERAGGRRASSCGPRARETLAEEMPEAYKDVDAVVDVCTRPASRARWRGCGRSASSKGRCSTRAGCRYIFPRPSERQEALHRHP